MAADYHLIRTPATGVVRVSDGKWIHEDPDFPNPEWAAYQAWLAEGNVPDGPDMPPGEGPPAAVKAAVAAKVAEKANVKA